MSVTRARHKRSLAYTLAFAVILTLAVPFATPAIAQVANDNTFGLAAQPEVDTNAVGSNHTITATLYSQTLGGVGDTTNVTNCDRAAGCEIDFEIESGPAVTVVSETPAVTGNTAGRTTDTDNTPGSPDMECLIANGTNSCSVVISSATQGDNVIRIWVDDDRDDSTSTADFDSTEGRNAGVKDCVAGTPNPQPAGFTADTSGDCSDTGAVVGSRSERDDTDVIQKTWFTAAVTTVRLDCDDDDTTDTETNAPGATETYTCFAFDTKGTAGLEDDTGVSGQRIEAENLGGANDPDNGFTNATADFNDACTTGSDGKCTFDLTAGENETGVANVCFWIDEDNDGGFSTTGGEFDGGECDAAGEWSGGAINTGTPTLDEYTATPQPANRTDPVQKTWAAPAPTTIDATPERDSNVKGSSHTISATVTDQFGAPSANAPVDFHLTSTSANAAAGPAERNLCNQVLTNSSGVATCTYTDSTTTLGPEPEQDTIVVCVDAASPGTNIAACDADDAAVDESTEAEFTNLGDRVEKFWFTTLPTAATLRVDMDSGPTAADCDDDDPTTPDNAVETNHDVCGIALSSAGAGVAGVNVDLALSGPGFFTSGQGTVTRADDPNLGTSITVTTDANGIWRATITSLQTGTTTLTATSGSASDTGTKTWTALAVGARNIDCEPETDTNPPATTHVITCTATDRLGNPVAGELISATETGPGRFDSDSTNVAASSTGQVEFVVSTTANETGAQTVVGVLDQDADDTTPLTRTADEQQDECDLLAGNPAETGESPAAPEGNCADEVTKTWSEEPQAECEDGIDNDGDGLIDFPDDPGCTSAADDDETDAPVARCKRVVATIAGTAGADTIVGTGARDVIAARGGNDLVRARGGNDLVCLARGNDTGNGGRGRDRIFGQRGGDLVKGGRGADDLFGNRGRDTLRGGRGNDFLRGGKGVDRCFGGPGVDRLRGCE